MPAKDRRRQRRSGPVRVISTFTPIPEPDYAAEFHASLKHVLLKHKTEERRLFLQRLRQGRI